MGSKNNDETILSKRQTYRNQLQKLECPFTWNMDNVIDSSCLKKFTNEESNDDDTENSMPLQKLLSAIMTVYVNVKDGKRESIEDDLKKCHDRFEILIDSNDPEISTKVARAVLQATECFVYLDLNKQEELERLLKNLENIDNMNDKEKSTLLGCKSICWAKYDRIGSTEAKELIREAIELNENCALWHYMLGKIIRFKRRASSAGLPCDEEANSFKKAYEISKCPIYGIFLAQMYRESKKHDEATRMYNDLFEDIDSLSTTVLMRSALGFINYHQFDKAKVCLDKAEKSNAKRSMYFHYRAKFHLKKREFEKASYYFKEAISDGNFFAELEYFQNLVKHQRSLDTEATKYLVNVLDKYKSLPEKQLQILILHIAISYWKRERDLKQAINYFLMAIEIDPQANCLMNFFTYDVLQLEDRDIYVLLEKFVVPEFDGLHHQFDEITLKKIEAIKKFCKLNNEAQMTALGRAFNVI